jgi:hypothetical protein
MWRFLNCKPRLIERIRMMQRISAYHAAGVLILGFAAGAGSLHLFHTHLASESKTSQHGQSVFDKISASQASGNTESKSASSSTKPVTEPKSFEDLWAANEAGLAIRKPRPQMIPQDDPWTKMMDLIKTDVRARADLMRRFANESNPAARVRMLALLNSSSAPEIEGFAMQMAISSDPSQRSKGLDLLRGPASESVEARSFLENMLRTEQDPMVLSKAINSLSPGLLPPRETTAVAKQLRTLAQHDSADVRAQSIQALPEWDYSPTIEAPIYQALTDQALPVRKSAILAIAQSGVRSDRLKSGLLNILNSESEEDMLKSFALAVLQRFTLSERDYGLVNKVNTELMSKAESSNMLSAAGGMQ